MKICTLPTVRTLSWEGEWKERLWVWCVQEPHATHLCRPQIHTAPSNPTGHDHPVLKPSETGELILRIWCGWSHSASVVEATSGGQQIRILETGNVRKYGKWWPSPGCSSPESQLACTCFLRFEEMTGDSVWPASSRDPLPMPASHWAPCSWHRTYRAAVALKTVVNGCAWLHSSRGKIPNACLTECCIIWPSQLCGGKRTIRDFYAHFSKIRKLRLEEVK